MVGECVLAGFRQGARQMHVGGGGVGGLCQGLTQQGDGLLRLALPQQQPSQLGLALWGRMQGECVACPGGGGCPLRLVVQGPGEAGCGVIQGGVALQRLAEVVRGLGRVPALEIHVAQMGVQHGVLWGCFQRRA